MRAENLCECQQQLEQMDAKLFSVCMVALGLIVLVLVLSHYLTKSQNKECTHKTLNDL